MNSNTIAVIIVVLLFISAIVGVVVYRKDKEKYHKCVCSSSEGGCQRNCQDIDTVQDLYDTRKLTEFTNFPNKGWSTTSPGDMNWPLSKGCDWPDNSTKKEWQEWDFTDFGN